MFAGMDAVGHNRREAFQNIFCTPTKIPPNGDTEALSATYPSVATYMFDTSSRVLLAR